MAGIGEAASIISVVQITEEIVKLCHEYLSDVRNAKRDIERVLEKTSDLSNILNRLRQRRDKSIDSIRLQKCCNDVSDLKKKIDPGVRRTTMRKMGLRALNWPLRKGDIESDISTLEDHLRFFERTINLDIEDKVDHADRDQQLDKLAFVGDAVFNSHENSRHRQCLENTRVDVLEDIKTWASSGSSQCIFWLKGMAGTGKSTIALTFAKTFYDTPSYSVATYFFKRGIDDLANARKLLPTLARQMAHQSPAFCSFLIPAIRADPILGQSATMKDQFDKLLIEPLRKLEYSTSSRETFVWIVDALDECDNKSGIQLLLRLIKDTSDIQKLRLRVFVTSRPDIPIRDGFSKVPAILHHDLALQDVSRAVVDKDISILLTHELAEIRARRGLPDNWPSPADVQTLVSRAAGLFVFASTACLYIDGARRADPQKRLQKVCDVMTDDQQAMKELDQMYTIALRDSIEADCYSRTELDEIITQFRRVVGTIVLLSDPLSISGLHELLCNPTLAHQNVIKDTLDPLHAVIDVPPEAQHPVRILHLSFRDFLLSRERCADSHFWVNQEETHSQLFLDCVGLMSRLLSAELISLPSGILRGDTSGKIADRVLSPALRYSCRYWIDHVRHSPEHLEDNGSLHVFFKAHALRWLTAMSVMNKVPEAIRIITELIDVLVKKAPLSLRLAEFTRDLDHFMRYFRHVIIVAPYQTYISGLTFSPKKSVVLENFCTDVPRWVSVKPPVAASWSTCCSALEGHTGTVETLAFSPDGQTVVSGSWDNTVRLWDTQTGECRILKGHSRVVSVVSYLPDGQTVVSVSLDGTVRLWDVQTGECRVLEGISDEVTQVACSSDGQRVVLDSENSMTLWDCQTGECRTLEVYSHNIEALACSPRGERVASGAHYDGTIWLWDVQTGECCSLNGHSASVTEIAFSPDGETIASRSTDEEVRLWAAQSHQCLATLKIQDDKVLTIAFSPDGQTVALGCDSGRVRLWNVQSRECLAILDGQCGMVRVIKFSPDGQTIASGYQSGKVQLWDMQAYKCRNTLEGHSGHVRTIAFSPNGQMMASASWDKTIRLWDIQVSNSCGVPEKILDGRYSGQVDTVIVSPDGQILASGSDDGKIRLWDMETYECRQTLGSNLEVECPRCFSSDGQSLVSYSRDGTLRVWDVRTGECRNSFTDKHFWSFGSFIVSIVSSPNGRFILTAAWNGIIKLWDIQTSEIYTFEGLEVLTNVQPTGQRYAKVAFSLNEQTVAASCGDDVHGLIQVWDVQTGECRASFESLSNRATTMALSPCGESVVLGLENGAIQLWDVKTGEHRTLGGRSYEDQSDEDQSNKDWSHEVSSVIFSSDGQEVASSSSGGTITLYKVSTDEVLARHESRCTETEIRFSSERNAVIANGATVPFETATYPSDSAGKMGTVSDDQEKWIIGLDYRQEWIVIAGKRVLWLPPEYRPLQSAVANRDVLVIGTASHGLVFFRFSLDDPELKAYLAS